MTLVLAPLGWLYGGVMRLRRWLYARGFLASHQLPGPVISVGNLEAGGTGKSPVVMALATVLRDAGARPAILTRGYRSGLGPDDSAVLLGSRVLLSPESGVSFHADEATMQAQKLGSVPVIIGAKRWAAARRYLQHHPAPTHWILDDGFQHLKLKRQFDIVLLDANAPFHNGRCIPAGRLRESPAALDAAQLILLTRAQNFAVPSDLQHRAAPCIPVRFINGDPWQLAGEAAPFAAQKAVLLALGIAQPQRVLDYCLQQKHPIQNHLLVGDHERFPLEKLQAQLDKADAILTTEKDFWRQPETFRSLQKPVYALPLEVQFPESFDLRKLLPAFTVSS